MEVQGTCARVCGSGGCRDKQQGRVGTRLEQGGRDMGSDICAGKDLGQMLGSPPRSGEASSCLRSSPAAG